MPLIGALERQAFSEAGPMPQALAVGENLAVMLLCLKDGQEIRPPKGDCGETVFSVLSGEGFILEGETKHPVKPGDVVHIPPGQAKALIAGEGELAVLGIRPLKTA